MANGWQCSTCHDIKGNNITGSGSIPKEHEGHRVRMTKVTRCRDCNHIYVIERLDTYCNLLPCVGKIVEF